MRINALFWNLKLLLRFDITRLRSIGINDIKWCIIQFITHYLNLELYFLDIKSDSQQNLIPDSDPAHRTCSGKNSFDENELWNLEKIKFMYLKLFKTSFVGLGPNQRSWHPVLLLESLGSTSQSLLYESSCTACEHRREFCLVDSLSNILLVHA